MSIENGNPLAGFTREELEETLVRRDGEIAELRRQLADARAHIDERGQVEDALMQEAIS